MCLTLSPRDVDEDNTCYPGTREAVFSLIEHWMDATDENRILWFSGPAGAGKTAIMKSITELAKNRGVHTINLFFRGDSTRNSAQPVVPTLLYQLLQVFPPSSKAIANILSAHPRILDTSISEQCKLIPTLSPIIQQLSPAHAPIVLLVDDLNECDVASERSQGDILRTLEGLVMEHDSPFRLLVASRPDAWIKMSFNQLSSQARTIFLDE